MSDLSSQLSAFKNRIRSGPSVSVKRAVTPKPAVVGSSPQKRRVEPLDHVAQAIKRQRELDSTLSGSHLSTKLHLAVEYIKQQEAPVPISKLEGYLSINVKSTLLSLLKEIDRIKYDPATETVEYTSLHNIQLSEDLLNFLRSQTTAKGVLVKELRDGWPGCNEAITELEEEGKIIALRNKKDNSPRSVWANFGGEIGIMDSDFVDEWSKIKVPDRDSLYEALVENSLKPTGEDPHDLKKRPVQQERKKKKVRRGKITNTHMKGILKDYSQLV